MPPPFSLILRLCVSEISEVIFCHANPFVAHIICYPLLAACTTDTWERCWEADFTAIGLNNRLFLVPGVMAKYVSIPPRLDVQKKKSLHFPVWKTFGASKSCCIAIKNRFFLKAVTYNAAPIYGSTKEIQRMY